MKSTPRVVLINEIDLFTSRYSMCYCIVFISSSLMTEEELAHIMRESQPRNRALGITGVLLYFNGSIIEVLEGSEENVKNMYATISRDSRHRHLTKLYAQQVEKRLFPDWLMGYKTLTVAEFKQLAHILPSPGKSLPVMPDNNNTILGLVHIFYRNNYNN